jgi:peptide alpha-N-acetyltransferase
MEKMDEARSLDIQDRYINTKCAKYQLRCDLNEEALKTMSLFTRVGDPVLTPCMKMVQFLTE